MAAKSFELNIALNAGPEADATELDKLTRRLLEEIKQEMNVESAHLKTQEAPTGTKAGEVFEAGNLVVSLASAGVFTALIEMLRSWALRKEGRTIKIETQIGDRSAKLEYSPTAASQEELTRFITDITRALESKGSSM
jgi:hypothetical protein